MSKQPKTLTIKQELQAIITASAAAKKALATLKGAYILHAKRGDNALSFVSDAIYNARTATRIIDGYAQDADEYLKQLH